MDVVHNLYLLSLQALEAEVAKEGEEVAEGWPSTPKAPALSLPFDRDLWQEEAIILLEVPMRTSELC